MRCAWYDIIQLLQWRLWCNLWPPTTEQDCDSQAFDDCNYVIWLVDKHCT